MLCPGLGSAGWQSNWGGIQAQDHSGDKREVDCVLETQGRGQRMLPGRDDDAGTEVGTGFCWEARGG